MSMYVFTIPDGVMYRAGNADASLTLSRSYFLCEMLLLLSCIRVVIFVLFIQCFSVYSIIYRDYKTALCCNGYVDHSSVKSIQ